MADILKFEAREKVYQLSFTTPPQIRMKKQKGCDIALELFKDPQDQLGYGTAWVPAKTRTQARRKLMDLLNTNTIKFMEN
jgi:hypothetical protein